VTALAIPFILAVKSPPTLNMYSNFCISALCFVSCLYNLLKDDDMSVLINIFGWMLIVCLLLSVVGILIVFMGPFFYVCYKICADIIRLFLPKKRLTSVERKRRDEREKKIRYFFCGYFDHLHW
jgi:FtsH-binding integral membrane protein